MNVAMIKDEQLATVLTRYQGLAFFEGCNLVNANSLANDGESLLHKAVMMKDVASIKILLQNSADPNKIGNLGETPLHQAAFQNNVEIAEILVMSGASLDIENEYGETPTDLAGAHKSKTLYNFLKLR